MGFQEHDEPPPIRLEIGSGFAVLTLNRPQRRNAVTRAMWRQLSATIGAAAADRTVRAIVLRGAGADFSAGADIGEFSTVRSKAQTARDYEADNCAAFTALRTASVPVIAAIRGFCFGGGFGLAAACDLRIAAAGAVFSVPAARLGLAYPAEAMADIVSAVGPQMARYLTYTGARLDADAALAAGFLLEVVDDARLDARATELAAMIAGNAPLSVQASKAAIRAAVSGRPDDLEAARRLGDATFESSDYAEGRAAFLAKRSPVFGGR